MFILYFFGCSPLVAARVLRVRRLGGIGRLFLVAAVRLLALLGALLVGRPHLLEQEVRVADEVARLRGG